MNIFNLRLSKTCLDPYCVMITGDKGSGKSSVFALIAERAIKEGLRVFCQYPYKGAYVIPMEKSIINGVERYDVDKEWLYTVDLTDSVVMLDEVKTIWPARSYAKWTKDDEEFFNFIRKFNTHLFLATQAYDGVDLNVKRASDEVWYLTKGILDFTHIEASRTTLCKVADKQTEVVGRMFNKGMRKIVWDLCEVPVAHYRFWRRPYYKCFNTNFTYLKKKEPELIPWSSHNEVFEDDKK